jgi:hypothetical protein
MRDSFGGLDMVLGIVKPQRISGGLSYDRNIRHFAHPPSPLEIASIALASPDERLLEKAWREEECPVRLDVPSLASGINRLKQFSFIPERTLPYLLLPRWESPIGLHTPFCQTNTD